MAGRRQSFSQWSSLIAAKLLLLMPAALGGSDITVLSNESIQDALDIVQPGDTITISAGHYFEDLVTRTDGTADQRITIRGGERNTANVVLRGAGDRSRMFEIKHDYYTIESFTIDGKVLEDANDDNYKDAYRDIPVYVTPDREPTIREGGHLSALDGLIIHDMKIKHAGGECLRLRYFVTNAEIYDNVIGMCGLYDFVHNDGGKNGEGVYIGTSSNQWGDGKNPTDEPDACRGNHIRDNTIRTMGNEGVEMKEGAIDNIVEYNKIYMQLDVHSGGINSRGDYSIIRHNYIEDAAGAGVRLGGHYIDGRQWGLNNQVYDNTMVQCMSYGVKISETPQIKICGNDIELPRGKDDDDYDYTGGEFGHLYDARDDCDPDAPSPTPTPDVTPSPTPGPTPTPDMTPSPTHGPTPTPDVPPSPTPGPTPMPSQKDVFEYLGCFADVRGERTMGRAYKDIIDMTNESCIDYCRTEGKRFAGTFRGHTCRCTNTESKVDRHGESTSCNYECKGDSSEICGGQWSVTSWEILS